MLCFASPLPPALPKIGYIYLSGTKRCHEEAITAYFDSAGREVAVLPCPDFEQFITDNYLLYRDLLFVSDLPRYIIRGSELRQFPALRLVPGPTFPIKFWAIIALLRYIPRALIPALLLPPVTPRLRRRISSGSRWI